MSDHQQVKRKPGRPRKQPIVETIGDQAKGGGVILSPTELATLQREAWETFEYDAPRGKTDSLGRIWSFDPEIKNGIKAVNLSVRRTFGPRYGTLLEVPVIGYQEARSVVEQIVNRLDGEVA